MPLNSPMLVSVLLFSALVYTGMASADEEASCTTSSEPGSCKAPTESSTRVAAGAPGLVLIQGKYAASIDVAGKRHTKASQLEAPERLECAPFSQWPNVDNGVTCGNCQALVSTVPYSRCEDYCGSFGHVCEAAAEEMSENCAVKTAYRCNQIIPATSDMLCTCRKPSPGETVVVPTTPAPTCGGGRSCAHCREEPPMHAGCLVVKDGRMLAIRITYGSRKFDTPGGQTNFKEPPSCTAHRETYEETGYEVTPTELLAGGLHGGGFNLYRCELLHEHPTKGHDHEVSRIYWLSKEEVQARLDQNLWRFPEAQRYVEWMR